MSDWKAETILSNPFVSGFIGSVIGLRAVNSNSWWERLATLVGGWGCAVLFGPALAEALHMSSSQYAFAGIVGAVGTFGLVIVDGALRYLKETPFVMLLRELAAMLPWRRPPAPAKPADTEEAGK